MAGLHVAFGSCASRLCLWRKDRGSRTADAGWLHGLKVVAVAVVAQAVWGMARSLCPDRERATIAILASIVRLGMAHRVGQILPSRLREYVGSITHSLGPVSSSISAHAVSNRKKNRNSSWIIFFTLLLGLPLLRQIAPSQALEVFDSFFRVGSLVFGGGHVVLPLFQAEVVGPGWVTIETNSWRATAPRKLCRGPFTFAAYLGAVMEPEPNGWAGAVPRSRGHFSSFVSLNDARCTSLLGLTPARCGYFGPPSKASTPLWSDCC